MAKLLKDELQSEQLQSLCTLELFIAHKGSKPLENSSNITQLWEDQTRILYLIEPTPEGVSKMGTWVNGVIA